MGFLIATIAITLVTVGLQEGTAHFQGKVSNKLIKLGQQLYTKMNKNSTLKNKIIEAYSSKDNQLMTAILNGAGFGPRLRQLEAERKAAKEKYNQEVNTLDNEQTDLTNKFNEVSSATYGNGTISGVVHSNNVYKNVSQQIEGGINNGEKVQEK